MARPIKERKVWHGIFRVNPVGAIARSSAIASFNINLFGASTRLYPAFLTEAELKAKKFDLNNAKRARIAWDRTKKIWFNLGGNPANLKGAIIRGWKKKAKRVTRQQLRDVRKKKRSSGFDGNYNFAGADDATVGTFVALGLPIVMTIIDVLIKSKVDKNPYIEGMEPSGFEEVSDQAVVQAQLPYLNTTTNQIVDPETKEVIETDDKYLGIPLMVWYVGGGLFVGAGLYLAISSIVKSNKPIIIKQQQVKPI